MRKPSLQEQEPVRASLGKRETSRRAQQANARPSSLSSLVRPCCLAPGHILVARHTAPYSHFERARAAPALDAPGRTRRQREISAFHPRPDRAPMALALAAQPPRRSRGLIARRAAQQQPPQCSSKSPDALRPPAKHSPARALSSSATLAFAGVDGHRPAHRTAAAVPQDSSRHAMPFEQPAEKALPV